MAMYSSNSMVMNPFLALASMGMNATSSLFGQYNSSNMTNPYDSAMASTQGLNEQVQQLYSPYMQAGQQSLGALQPEYMKLMQNPQQVMQMLGGGYQQSPGYQHQYEQALNGANMSAAAGGMAGSPAAQQQAASAAGNVANEDYWNYMSQIMKLYGMGLGGLGDINQMGYKATNTYSNDMQRMAQAQAEMLYLQQEWENQNKAASGLFGLF